MVQEIQTQNIIIMIVYLIILLVGAYYLTKYISKRAMQKGTKRRLTTGDKSKWKQGQFVSVVDRIPIDRDKTIMVVEFNSKHYLMVTTGQDIKILDKVEMYQQKATEQTDEELEEKSFIEQNMEPQQNQESFFKRFWSSFKVVSKNYYKNKNTAPFGIHLQKEMDIKKEVQDIHPDNGKTDSINK